MTHAHSSHRGHEHLPAHDHAVEREPANEGGPGPFSAHEARQARRLALVIAIIGSFFVLELVGALVAGSVVLQADALHLLMDVLSLSVSLFAMRLAVRRPTVRFTYGLRRAEPVAAVFSALLVLSTTAFIVAEAIEALHAERPPKAGVMLWVASLALIVNGLSAWLLHDVIDTPHAHGPGEHHHGHDHGPHGGHAKAHGHALNLRGAWLHLFGDTLGAMAAVCAALVIHFGGHPSADAIASFVVAGILLVASLRLLHDATMVLLEAAPSHLPVPAIREAIAGFPGVIAVHELHIWTLGAGHEAVTAHVQTDSTDPAFAERLSAWIRATLGTEYVTVQAEPTSPAQADSDAT